MEQRIDQGEPERDGLDEDWAIVEALLPERWMEMARESGVFRRARGIADARALLKVMLIHLAEGCSLRETAVRANRAGIAQVSDVALLKRLRSCGPWFEWLAQRLRETPELRVLGSHARQPLLGDRRLRVVDGSIVREPGPTGTQWRLHYAIGLPGLQCQEVHVGPSAEGETLKRFEVRAGDIFMADRGYAHPGGVAHVTQRGGDVIVRLNLVTLPLYETDAGQGTRSCDILAHARSLKMGQARSWEVSVRPKPEPGSKAKARGSAAPVIAGRLCVLRKCAEAAARSRERVRRESQRGGTALQPQTLEAADYVFVFTTLAPEVSAEQVLEVYRLRWQIELEFKRLKSLIQLGHLKKHDDQAARSWLQGKLLVALLVARLIAHAERISPWGYEIAWFEQSPQRLPVA